MDRWEQNDYNGVWCLCDVSRYTQWFAMDKCRVYILYENSLFAEGVSNLLYKAGGIEVVGTSKDLVELTYDRNAPTPHVIIVETSIEENQPFPPPLLALPEATIVGLSLSSNRLVIYRREQQMVTEADDFIRIVKSLAVANAESSRTNLIANSTRHERG